MENLTIHEHRPMGSSGHGPHPNLNQGQSSNMPPPTVPQLPPQMFTTAAQLLDLTDKKLMVCLRDGRKLIGVLRSWDQFGNLMLQNTVERLFAQQIFADVERGLFLIRGENVLLLGEIDLDKEDDIPPNYTPAPAEDVFELHKAEQHAKKIADKAKAKRMQRHGFEVENLIEGTL